MSIDWFLEQVKSRFEAGRAKSIITALRSDNLVWKALDNDTFQHSWLDFAGNDPKNWQPGMVALLTLSPDLTSQDLRNPAVEIPGELAARATRTLETIRLTGLEPGSLADAALLALKIREFRHNQGSWQGLVDFFAHGRNNPAIWKTPLAVLPVLVEDFEAALTELIATSPTAVIPEVAAIIVHALETNFMDDKKKFAVYADLLKTASPDFQIQALTAMKPFAEPAAIQYLANNFISRQEDAEEDKSLGNTPVEGLQNVEAYQKQAALSQLAGQPLQASKAIQSAFDALNHNQALLLRNLAVGLELTNPEEARKTWEEVLRVAPDTATFKKEFAEFLIAHDEADYGYELLEQLQDDSVTTLYSLRYPGLRQKADQDGALKSAISRKSIRAGTSRFSDKSDNLEAARYAFDQKNYPLAEDFIGKALLSDPNDLETLKLSGLIHQHLADVDSAIDSASLVALFEPENLANKKELAALFLQTQQPEKALDIYHELISSRPNPARADLLTYAEVALKAGKPEVAVPIARSFLGKDQLDGEALVILSNALISAGQEDEAVTLLEKTSAIAPEKPSSWLSLAMIWTRLGETDRAMESLRMAKAALPDEPEILAALGKLYLENDKPTEAISVLKQAFRLDPNSQSVRKSLTRAYLQHGYIDEAWTVIGALEEDYTSDPELALILGETIIALGDTTTPKPMLKFAWQSNRSTEALKSYAGLLLQQTRNHETPSKLDQKELNNLLSSLQERIDEGPEAIELKLLAADVKAALGMQEEAYQDYIILLDHPEAKAPKIYHHLQSQIGLSAMKLGMNDISLASLQEAVLVRPDDITTRHILSEAYAQADLGEESLAAARSALQIAPTELENVLWYSDMMCRNNNEKEAIQVLKDAIHLRPDERALYLTLARIYVGLGEIDNTKTTLDRMLATEGVSTEEYVNVANLYLHMQKPDEASAVIKQAIGMNPEPDFAETCELTYSVLRLGDAPAAAQLVSEYEEHLGSHPCYPILKADVLEANRAFIDALDTLQPVLRELEFNGEPACQQYENAFDPGFGTPDYTPQGIHYRAAQLERAVGDLTAAQKFASLAQKADPGSEGVLVLQAELALATRNTAILDQALDYLNTQESDTANLLALAQLLALDALLREDYSRVSLLNGHFLANARPTPISLAVQAILSKTQGDFSAAQKATEEGAGLLEELDRTNRSGSFNISAHFAWVWGALGVVKAAWEVEDWPRATELLHAALAEIKVNPIANKLTAEYLADKARAANNAALLHVTSHSPLPFGDLTPDSDLLDEQVSIAGRYIPAAEMLPVLKIGQAIFEGRWQDGAELSQFVKSGKQAAQVLSVLVNEETIKEIAVSFPQDYDVTLQQAILLLHDQPEKSAELASELLTKNPGRPLLYAIEALASRDDPALAAETLESALAIWPDETGWHALAATFYTDAKMYPEAASHLEDALRLAPKNAQYWQMLGDVKLLEKDYHAAKDYFGKATDLFPGNPEALESLAIINQRLGEHLVAIQCLQKAAQLDPENPAYGEAIAESLLAKKEFSQALNQAETVLQAHPNSQRALQVKAQALVANSQPGEARQVIKLAIEIAQDPVPFELIAIALDAKHNQPHGLNASSALAETYPENPMVLNNLAHYQLEAGLQAKAGKTLQKSLEIEPANAETLLMLGKLARATGNLDQALAHLNQALQLDPSLMEAYLEMGQTYQDRRDVNKAIEIYHKAIVMVSKDPRPYMSASAAYKDSRDYRNAEQMLRQAAELSPRDQGIRRQLAGLVALNLVNNLQEAPKRK